MAVPIRSVAAHARLPFGVRPDYVENIGRAAPRDRRSPALPPARPQISAEGRSDRPAGRRWPRAWRAIEFVFIHNVKTGTCAVSKDRPQGYAIVPPQGLVVGRTVHFCGSRSGRRRVKVFAGLRRRISDDNGCEQILQPEVFKGELRRL